jgi:nitroreductase
MAYHQLEKGLSYAQPRPGFGVEVVERLFDACDRLVRHQGYVAPVTTAVGVLRRYIEFQRAHGIDVDRVEQRLERSLSAWGAPGDQPAVGGSRAVTAQALQAEREAGFTRFFLSRHSVRNFAAAPIPPGAIAAAVALAQKTPSVCNRQAGRVHVFERADDIKKLLAIQAGARGFGEAAGAVLVVTCELGNFVDVGERYQAWIDGGMFAMSLCLALHEQGLGSCCLNWSKEASTDRALRKVADLPVSEQIIMLIAVGTLPDSFNVAWSERRDPATVLVTH